MGGAGVEPPEGPSITINLYAELLPHIRQLSLAATISLDDKAGSLSTSSKSQISAALTHNGSSFRVTFGGESASLSLPSGALGPPNSANDDASEIPLAVPSNWPTLGGFLSWRLPAAAVDGKAHLMRREPWSAADLVPRKEVRCGGAGCKAVLVQEGALDEWKDLPSENWAEMMEFWHCHKPDCHDHDNGHGHGEQAEAVQQRETGKASEEALASRGYGASSAIVARRGVGLVDLMSILLDDVDVQGVVYSFSTFARARESKDALLRDATPSPSSRNISVFCASCERQVGSSSPAKSSTSLLKWQIVLSSIVTAPPTLSRCLAATLAATVARSGSSKALLIPQSTSSEASAIHVWILNGAIHYASSAPGAVAQPLPAMKLLYRVISRGEAEGMLETVTDDAQEVNLPEEAVLEITAGLDASNAFLPARERGFKGWKVGLLERWDDGG